MRDDACKYRRYADWMSLGAATCRMTLHCCKRGLECSYLVYYTCRYTLFAVRSCNVLSGYLASGVIHYTDMIQKYHHLCCGWVYNGNVCFYSFGFLALMYPYNYKCKCTNVYIEFCTSIHSYGYVYCRCVYTCISTT